MDNDIRCFFWYYPDTKKSASHIHHSNLMEKQPTKDRFTKQICLVKNWTYRARVMDQNAESLYSCGFSAFVFINACAIIALRVALCYNRQAARWSVWKKQEICSGLFWRSVRSHLAAATQWWPCWNGNLWKTSSGWAGRNFSIWSPLRSPRRALWRWTAPPMWAIRSKG